MDSTNKPPKEHKKRHSGVSADKKKDKNRHLQDGTAKERNPKAFRANAPSKLRDNFRRKQDIISRKHHIPVVDHHSEKHAPVVIAIVGPPKSGKTTLLTSLVKVFTRKRISSIKGPITVVGGKKRRYTFIEVNNDINSMIDVAKVCDVAIFIIDITMGIEMEVFEFIEVCRQHGTPKFLGIINHLDLMKDNKSLKRKKKELIRRVESELHWKPFFLRGMVRNEYILNEITELSRRLSAKRFAPKPFQDSRPFVLVDRLEDNTSEALVTANPKCDRDVALYGYIRGSSMMDGQNVHIPGVGDYWVEDVEFLPDPCPIPDGKKRRSLLAEEKNCYAPHSGVGGMFTDRENTYVELQGHKHGRYILDRIEEEKKKNSTKDEDNESGVGSDQESEEEEKDITVKMRADLQTLTAKNSQDSDDVQLFSSSNGLPEFKNVIDSSGEVRRVACFNDVVSDGSDSESEGEEKDSEDEEEDYEDEENNNDDDSSDDDDYFTPNDDISRKASYTSGTDSKKRKLEAVSEEDRIAKVARLEGSDPNTRVANLLAALKGETLNDEEKSDQPMHSDEDESSSEQRQEDLENEEHKRKMFENAQKKFDKVSPAELYTKMLYDDEYLEKAVLEFNGKLSNGISKGKMTIDSDDEDDFLIKKPAEDDLESNIDMMVNMMDSVAYIKSKLNYVGKVNSDQDLFIAGFKNNNADDLLKLSQDEELFGDFEDLETGEKHSADAEEDEEEKPDDEGEDGDTAKTEREREILEKKRKKKEVLEMLDLHDDKNHFDALKEELGKQAQLNRNVYCGLPDSLRVQYEGFRPGMYVRMRVKRMPAEFVTGFDASYPLIVGGLNANEMPTFAYHSVKMRVHRWYPKILKNNDPLILSLGWRRFQTQMTYGVRHDDLKLKFMKYARKHLTVEGIFWGPGCPENMGVVCLQSVSVNDRKKDYRICATGVMQGADKTTQVRKKLKLIGHPDLKSEKIFKKTAFVTDMFHNEVEVGAFVGAKIQTQAGIRGIIKGPSGKDGRFRAMFEDTIKRSDVIILKTWTNVEVPRYCVYVKSLLLPIGSKNTWEGMKTVGQLKAERNIKNEANKDSMYTEITQRRTYEPQPLKIPSKLQAALPFEYKPKHTKDVPELDRVLIIKDPKQEKLDAFLRRAKAMHDEKEKATEARLLKKQRQHKIELRGETFFRNKNIKKKKAEACKKTQFIENARAKRGKK